MKEMLDLTKNYCLKNSSKTFMINRQVSEEDMMNDYFKERGAEVDDYMCQWFEKDELKTEFFKEHQIEEFKPISIPSKKSILPPKKTR